MKKKSVSIYDEKIKEMIEEKSNELGISESKFVELLLNNSIDNKEGLKLKTRKDNKALFKSIIETNMQDNPMIILSEVSLDNDLELRLNKADFFNKYRELDGVKIKGIIKNEILKYVRSEGFYIKDGNLTNYRLKNDEKTNVMTLSLVEVSNIKIIDNLKTDLNKIKEIEGLYEKTMLSLINDVSKGPTLDLYWALENRVNSTWNESVVIIRVSIKGFLLPIVIDDNINFNHNFYDYVNVRYLSHRNFKKYEMFRECFLVMMNCRYGFFACNILDTPKDSRFFMNKIHELNNREIKRENMGTFIDGNNIIKFSPDYSAIKIKSTLLKMTIKTNEIRRKLTDKYNLTLSILDKELL